MWYPKSVTYFKGLERNSAAFPTQAILFARDHSQAMRKGMVADCTVEPRACSPPAGVPGPVALRRGFPRGEGRRRLPGPRTGCRMPKEAWRIGASMMMIRDSCGTRVQRALEILETLETPVERPRKERNNT